MVLITFTFNNDGSNSNNGSGDNNNDDRQVSVSSDLCKSSLIHDMVISCTIDNSSDNSSDNSNNGIKVVLPNKFANVIDNYVMFVTNVGLCDDKTKLVHNCIKEHSIYLLHCLQLSDFIDDNCYFNYLLQLLFDHWCQQSSLTVYSSDISYTLQYKILLYCPYDFLPQKYIDDDTFMKAWFNTDSPRTIKVNNNHTYCINHNSINKRTEERTVINYCYTLSSDSNNKRLYTGKIFIISYFDKPNDNIIKMQYCYIVKDNYPVHKQKHLEVIIKPDIYLLTSTCIHLNNNHVNNEVNNQNEPNDEFGNNILDHNPINDVEVDEYDNGVDDNGVDDNGVDDNGVDDNGVDDNGVDDNGVDDNEVYDNGVYDNKNNSCHDFEVEFGTNHHLSGILYECNVDSNNMLIPDVIIPHGCWKRWYLDSKTNTREPMYVNYYDNGKRVGKWTGYFDSHNLEYEVEFTNEGKRHGDWIVYHDNYDVAGNKIHLHHKYNNGIKCGQWFDYDQYGIVQQHHTYVNGKLHGMCSGITYHMDTNIHTMTVNFVNGLRQGLAQTISDQGEIVSREIYVDNYFHGDCNYYYTSDDIMAYNNYHQQLQTYSIHGVEPKLSKKWPIVGQLRHSCHMNNGKIHGLVKSWDEQGRLIGQQYYDNGMLIDSVPISQTCE